jgi:glycosyltransferase involved in cell wall biosynthesis
MTNGGKTLVILSPGFPKNEADTACIPPQQVFVRNLKQNNPGLNVIVLAFEYPFFSSQYQWNGVTVISFGGQSRGKLVRLRNWVRAWLILKRLNKEYQIVGLLSFWISDCAFVANAFAKKNNLKHFCWILGQDAKPGNKYFGRIKPNGDSLIALSDFISKEIDKNYSVKPVHIIPVGIDPALFSSPEKERDINILAAGSLIPLKQFSVLINIVSILNIYFPGIKTVICGDGTERESLNEMVKEHRLENNIQFTGELPHTSVLKLMQRTKIFVHPSAYEGFGVVCLEALHAGAQVVSFVRPMDTQIKNWHITNTEDGMLNVIKELLDDPACQYSPVTPYLINDTCKAIMELFD